MRRLPLFAVGVTVGFLAISAAIIASTQQGKSNKAPELTGGKGWINTDKPVTLAQLRGKVVLLDFWTYC